MACMFYAASTFDGDLSKWYVARVTDMKCTFYGASAFNGDLSKWYVAKVTDMACKIRNRIIFGFGTLAQAAILCSFVIFVRIPKPNNFRFRNVGSGGHRLGEWCSGLTMKTAEIEAYR